MKKLIGITAAMLLTGFTFTSCKTSNDKIEDAKEDVVDAKQNEAAAEEKYDAVKNDTAVSDYQKLKAGTDKLIADNETRIAEFKVKLKTESAANQKKFQARIDKLEARNNELKADLDSYADTGKEKWDAFKNRVQKSIDDIDKDIQDYKKEHNY
ncbi:hypothetical protein [Flavobacterium sp. 3HN19-14]|uniref:hypothetical protein n=1 Tax=Flavobacterium sp. 3HN19-14 TaxID=3448133 RepID=UPI003EE074FD